MATEIPYPQKERSSASEPKALRAALRKSASLKGILAVPRGQHCPPHCPPPSGRSSREQGPVSGPSDSIVVDLGTPLDARQVASLIGCSPWTVRHALIPRGLPHFRFRGRGRLIFYRDQVIRWIERQQQGGQTTQ